jgi:hypothetical protein
VHDHLPISMIEKTGTLARYMAIAAPERMDLVPIPDRRMPSFVSPIVTTPSRHKSAIISPITLMIWLCGVCVCVDLVSGGRGLFGERPDYRVP